MPVAEADLANLTTEQQVELANKEADAAAAAAPVDTPPVDESTPVESTEETPPAEPDEQDAQVLEFFRNQLGDQPWLKNFKTAADLAKALPEMQSLIGRQSQAVAALRNLEAMGLTAEEIAKWMAQKTQPQPSSNGKPQETPKSFAVRGADGKFYPSAKSPTNWESLLNQELAAATDRLLDPSQMAEALKPYLTPAMSEELGKTKQEVNAAIAQQADQAKYQAMFEQNKELYYTDAESGAYKSFTPLGQRIDELLREGLEDQVYGATISTNLPQWKRLERAHQLAMREMPKAQPRNVPANAKPIQQPKVAPGKAMSADEWMKNNTFNGNKDAQFRAFNDAVNNGTVKLD